MNEVATAKQHPLVKVREQFEGRQSEFASALPAHIPVERFVRVVMTAIQINPQLLDAPRVELFNAAMKAAQDGLLPDGRDGALVCRPGRNGVSVTWQPMIGGIRKKARNSGEIATWDAHVVYGNDHFQFQLGDAPQVNHSYDLRADRGEPIGAYSVAVMKDGSKSYEVMSVSDINAIRDTSDAWKAFKAGKIKSTPWATHWGEMARKTVARRHAKVLPMSTDLDDLIRRDDELYSFKDAGDAAVKGPRPPLNEALDRLAAPAYRGHTAVEDEARQIITEDGEIVKTVDADEDQPPVAEPAQEPSAPPHADEGAGDEDVSSKPAADPAPEPTKPEPAKIDPLAMARERGRKARADGLARRALPGEYRQEGREAERDEWEGGWDEAGERSDG